MYDIIFVVVIKNMFRLYPGLVFVTGEGTEEIHYMPVIKHIYYWFFPSNYVLPPRRLWFIQKV